jgi:hypothetical protein
LGKDSERFAGFLAATLVMNVTNTAKAPASTALRTHFGQVQM